MLSWLGRLVRGKPHRAAATPETLAAEAAVHRAAGRLEEAERCLYRALAVAPSEATLHLQLGDVFRQQRKFDAALQCCVEAARLAPASAAVRNNLGNAYRDLGDAVRAEAEFRHALVLDPGLPEAQFNLGLALHKQERAAEALGCYRAAAKARPGFALAHLNAGFVLEEVPDTVAAIEAYAAAARADPALVEAHVNLGMQLLLAGRLAEGWPEYEWRLRYPEYSGADLAEKPRWRGEFLDGRTILLDAEQGFGDALQFLRYAPLVAARGGRVLVRCAPELAALVARVAGVAAVVPRGALLPAFDLSCPLPSLPGVLGTTLATVPAEVPYVRADEARAARWKARYAAAGGSLNVGLVWASQSQHRTAPDKSLPLAALAPLAGVPEARFYSLQKGAAAREAPPAGLGITELGDELLDFSDTAAAVSGLDLVISVDTAVAHLAGAMGRPTWTLLKAAPDWRWLLGREDCPWYPTMRLFRQERAGDWGAPVTRLAGALRAYAAGKPPAA
jgi:Flp pilus assembly protein TadD